MENNKKKPLRIFLGALTLIFFAPCTSSALEYELQNLTTALAQLAGFLESSSTPESEFYAKFEPVRELSRNLERIQTYDLVLLHNLSREVDEQSQEAETVFGTDIPRDVARALTLVHNKVKERIADIQRALLEEMLLHPQI